MTRFALSEIRGVIPAMVTPFDEEGALDFARTAAVARHLMDAGIGGLYLTGSTGEAFMMSPEERASVVETVCREVKGKIPVIAHVGAISTFQSVRLAEAAQEAGADAISAVPPFYWGFTADQVAGYYADITAATDLPMIAYNVPLAGALGYDMIERLAGIDGIGGVKYTASTHHEISRLKREVGDHFQIFSGSDEMAMSGLAFGADAIIGSFYNVMPEVFARLLDAMEEGRLDDARELQETANAVIFHTLERHPVATLKRILAWQGADAGYCRKPLGNHFGAGEEAALKNGFRDLKERESLSGVGFLDAL